MKINGINHSFTAPYHPATNGAAENAVKSVKKSKKIALKSNVDVDLAIDRYLMIIEFQDIVQLAFLHQS